MENEFIGKILLWQPKFGPSPVGISYVGLVRELENTPTFESFEVIFARFIDKDVKITIEEVNPSFIPSEGDKSEYMTKADPDQERE